jgi:hypothetical protein
MATQGWTIDNVGHKITFFQPPANGAAITVKEYAQGAVNSTDYWALGAWGPATGYPSVVEFFGQRLFFAGTANNPQTLWASKISNYTNFGKSVPTADDDAITATIAARQVNAITDLVPLKDMIVLTVGAEWKSGGGTNNVLTPSTISFTPTTNYGASTVPALVVGDSGVFVQGRGSYVRDIGYQFSVDNYTGTDLTVFASHLVQGFTIVDWAYQQTPWSVIWAVRNDGALLGLAYFKEQEVSGWFHCDWVNGFVESVCCITEGGKDVVYLSIRRVINGNTVRYIERMGDRFFTDQRDYFFVDAGLTYDGRNSTAAPAATMTLTGGVNWVSTENLTLTCAGYTPFSPGSIGNWVKLYINTPVLDSDGNPVTDEFGKVQTTQSVQVCQVNAYTSSSVVTVRSIGSVSAPFQNVAIGSWDYCPKTFSGLSHLEGQTVAILADGNVKPRGVVTGGSVSIDYPAAVVHIGLPIQSDFQTLEVTVVGGESIRSKQKSINQISLIVENTRGAKFGRDVNSLTEVPPRQVSDGYYNPNSVQNDLINAYITNVWSQQGSIFIRQDDPLPLGILGVIVDTSVGAG